MCGALKPGFRSLTILLNVQWMLSNFNPKRTAAVRHRAVSLWQHGFLVYILIRFKYIFFPLGWWTSKGDNRWGTCKFKSKSIYFKKSLDAMRQWSRFPKDTDVVTHAQQKKITQQWNTQAYDNSSCATKGVKSTNSSLCLNTEMLLALIISLDKLFQISITR